MRVRSLVPLGFLFVAAVCAARDFRPEGWYESIPATDGSIQQSYVFRTLPGVIYRVEHSDDLATWTAGDEIYGLGHDYITPMFQTAPPPPPEPGGEAPAAPAAATHAAWSSSPRPERPERSLPGNRSTTAAPLSRSSPRR